jgi:Fe-S oxidoreductase
MNPALTAALLAVGLFLFGASAWRRLRPLAALREDPRTGDVPARLRALLRYGLGQARVLDREERVPGALHVVLLVAFFVLSLRTVTLFGMGFTPGFHLPGLSPASSLGAGYAFVKDVAVLGALVAGAAFLWRRLVTRPDRLTHSWEGSLVLGFIIALMVTELGFDGAERLISAAGRGAPPALDPTAPAGSLAAVALAGLGLSPVAAHALGIGAFWLHLVVVLAFLNFLPHGKHFHVLTALPNVYLRSLPPASAALRVLDLEREDATFGTRTVADLSWKEALDAYSCTECGRCQTHCPAHRTGKPLSAKQVNLAVKQALSRSAAGLVTLSRARDPAAREAVLASLPPITDAVAAETFWSCTTCGWCETGCPVLVENVPRLVDMRRHKVLVEADFPDEAARMFKGLETQGNPWGIGSNRRTEWCEDLAVTRASDGQPFEWLFFVGCAGAFDERQRKVSRALVRILRAANVSFAILGEEETCNGEAARRLGNEYLFQQQAQANVETMNRYGVRKIVVQCPHCLNTFRNELPRFGGRYEVVHHTELIASLVASGRLAPTATASEQTVTFHDPCYLARHNGVEAAPRAALAAAGVRLTEMLQHGARGFCCGAGGGRMWLEEKLGTRVNRARAEEAVATLGARGGVVAAACPFCITMLKDGVAEIGREEQVRVLDVAEIVASALPPGERRSAH